MVLTHKVESVPALLGTDCEGALVPSASIRDVTENFPRTLEDYAKVEDLLASEMENLSLEKRDKILFDLHGITETEEEDENKINDLLEQLDVALRRSRSNKEAYQQATYLNESYVTSRKFRLLFLRGESYDPKGAAERLIQHFTVKRQLFGSGEILGREVRLSDLSKDDMESLESGFLQIFPMTDAAGRTIFSFSPCHRISKTLDNMARVHWYMLMACLWSDEELQKKGHIFVIYGGERHSGMAEEVGVMRRVNHARSGLPIRLAGCHHFCGTNPALRVFISGIRVFLSKEIRTRMRPHYGSHEDMIFNLQTFGIKAEDHPIRADGSLSLEWHHEWLRLRKAQEELSEQSASPEIIVPRRFDVLFGRGKNNREHTGNLRAAHLVAMYQQQYEESGKFDKTKIATHILSIIHESCGRFLKLEKHGWVEVDDNTAREKVSHFFRQNRVVKKDTDEQSSEMKSTTKRTSPCASPDPEAQGAITEKAAKRLRDPLPDASD